MIKNIHIPQDESFIEYLLKDSFDIPEEILGDNLCTKYDTCILNGKYNEQNNETLNFYDKLMLEQCKGIKKFQGEVYPKQNWNGPKDASWMSPDKMLCCRFVKDILLLLKSSYCPTKNFQIMKPAADEYISKNLNEYDKYDKRLYIVLLKWSNLFPSREFRIFTISNIIVGITQRDFVMYEELQSYTNKQNILQLISQFHTDIFIKYFQTDHNYSYDIYIDKNDKIFVIDISALHINCTDGILFSLQDELLPLIEFEPYTEQFMRKLHHIRLSPYLQSIFESQSNSTTTIDNNLSMEYISTSLDCIPFRIVKDEHQQEGNRRAIIQSTAYRLPSDDINVSDSQSIEAFIASQNVMAEDSDVG